MPSRSMAWPIITLLLIQDTSARIRAHLRRCRPRPGAQRTGSTPRARRSRGALQLDPSPRARLSVAIARALKAAAFCAEQHVERCEASVAAGDISLQVELLFGRERRIRVDLLLEHAEAITDADDLLEEGLDGHVLRLDVGLARNHPERPAGPSRRELQVHVDPTVLAQDVTHRLPDAIGFWIPLLLLHLEGVERPCDTARVATAE